MEDRHRMAGAIFAYPLFENAIRGFHGRSIEAHMQAMGRLFARAYLAHARDLLKTRVAALPLKVRQTIARRFQAPTN